MRTHAVIAALWGMAIELVACRAIPAQEPVEATPLRAAPKPGASTESISAAVSQLVEQLRRHPPQPSKASDRVAGLYMIEISTGSARGRLAANLGQTSEEFR